MQTLAPAELAMLHNQISKDAEALHAEFIRQCDEYLIDMDVEGKSVPFKFPYVENGVVKLADGVMEAERMILGGHVYEIDAPGPITLVGISFKGGYAGETHMEGVAPLGFPAPATSVATPKLYAFLNKLRVGLAPGESESIWTTYGSVEFTSRPSHVARLSN